MEFTSAVWLLIHQEQGHPPIPQDRQHFAADDTRERYIAERLLTGSSGRDLTAELGIGMQTVFDSAHRQGLEYDAAEHGWRLRDLPGQRLHARASALPSAVFVRA